MFTGLIQSVCSVRSAAKTADAMRLDIELGELANQVKTGDSIAINGACLTVSGIEGSTVRFDVSGETLTMTTLGNLTSAAPANVELALKPADRLGGHFVQGHIDGTATIRSVDRSGKFANITLTAGADLLDQMIVKGSVAVDGVSLTIAAMTRDSFSIVVIPETLERTTLGTAKVGNIVNIETDIIGKIVRKQLEKILPTTQSLTVEKLKELGF